MVKGFNTPWYIIQQTLFLQAHSSLRQIDFSNEINAILVKQPPLFSDLSFSFPLFLFLSLLTSFLGTQSKESIRK